VHHFLSSAGVLLARGSASILGAPAVSERSAAA
jgi:hypothetical protein